MLSLKCSLLAWLSEGYYFGIMGTKPGRLANVAWAASFPTHEQHFASSHGFVRTLTRYWSGCLACGSADLFLERAKDDESNS